MYSVYSLLQSVYCKDQAEHNEVHKMRNVIHVYRTKYTFVHKLQNKNYTVHDLEFTVDWDNVYSFMIMYNKFPLNI